MSGILFTEGSAPGTPSSGKVELYAKTDGALYYKDDVGTETLITGLTRGTSTSLSGTSVLFTGIPSTASKITVMISNLSTNGTSAVVIRIGPSGGVDTTGYVSSGGQITNSNTTSVDSVTSGFPIASGGAAGRESSGIMTLARVNNSNLWVAAGTFSRDDAALVSWGAGRRTASGTVDRISITTAGGTDTFDSGTVNILVE